MFVEALTFDDINIIPKYSEIEHRSDCNVGSRLTKQHKINIPIIAAPMDTVCESDMAIELGRLGGARGCIHRFNTIDEQMSHIINITLNSSNNELPIVAAVGSTGDFLERATALANINNVIILIDVAHGNHINVKKAIEKIKSNLNNDVIVGNVCTAEGAMNLCEWGADAVRVGIGNGSLCETRIRTGIGIPQVRAIKECVSSCIKYNVPVIADGGIRYTGDIAKSLALGAETVMLGSLLSGTKESPGKIKRTGQWPNEQLFKSYRGSASLEAKQESNMEEKNVEGNSKIIPYKGKVKRIITDIVEGLQSSMSYVNAKNIKEFQTNVEFVKITNSGIIEAKPHLITNN